MNSKMKLGFPSLIGAIAMAISLGVMPASAQTQKATNALASAIQQPLYGDYKGVRIGMPAAEVRAKLGTPTMKADDQDYYIVSQSETVQIAYDAQYKATAISVDYIDGVGAPDYRTVVGPDIERAADGSMHKRIDYESLGFWVSFHRTAGTVPTVTVTIQKTLLH